MFSSAEVSSLLEIFPSPLVSSFSIAAFRAASIELVSVVDEVEEVAEVEEEEPPSSAVLISSKLREPSPSVSALLISLEARSEAVGLSCCRESRLERVSAVKRLEA